MAAYHEPVLVREVMESLRCRVGGVYVDGTVGGGGHAAEILKQSAPGGMLIGIDRDDEALAAAASRLSDFGSRKILVKGNYVDIAAILAGFNIKSVDGILLDLGVSSHQLEEAQRGFSFAQGGPLDMRMDRAQGYSASDLINNCTENELARIIRDYGEERMAGRIARAIVRKRSSAPIATTAELAAIIVQATPAVYGRQKIHPATRTFQAIRIAVNDELTDLPLAINSCIEALAAGGRLAIIAFHSLEDRIVKNEFRAREGGCTCPPRLPVCVCKRQALLRVLTKKPLRPALEELTANPRARSARLRVAERI